MIPEELVWLAFLLGEAAVVGSPRVAGTNGEENADRTALRKRIGTVRSRVTRKRVVMAEPGGNLTDPL